MNKSDFEMARKFFKEPNPRNAETPNVDLLAKIAKAGIQGVTIMNDIVDTIGHATLPQQLERAKAPAPRQHRPRF